jgi:hypothetical protein
MHSSKGFTHFRLKGFGEPNNPYDIDRGGRPDPARIHSRLVYRVTLCAGIRSKSEKSRNGFSSLDLRESQGLIHFTIIPLEVADTVG